MSGTAGVRLVRCPKCENLLPEVKDYSVFQCGGCGAVLGAKNKGVDLDASSEKSDEERIGGYVGKLSDRYEEMLNVSERRKINTSDGSDSDMRSNVSSSSRVERRILRDKTENNRPSVTSRGDKWSVKADVMRDKRLVEHQHAKIGQGFKDMMIYGENKDVLQRSGRVLDRRNGEKSEMEGLRMAQRIDAEVMDHTKGGPSNILYRSSYDKENPSRNRNNENGFSDVDYIGEDRIELLKKLDELKDHLSRSGHLIDKGKEKVPHDRRMDHQDPYAPEEWHADASREVNRVLMQNPYPDRPRYQSQYDERPPLMRRQEMGSHGFYPPEDAQSRVPGYGDPSRFQTHRRGPYHAPAPYPHAHRSGPYQDGRMVYVDPIEPHPPNSSCHHPSCSCYQCCNKRQVPNPILPAAYGDKYADIRNDSVSSYRDNCGSFGLWDYKDRLSHPLPSRSHNTQSHARWPSGADSEVHGFIHRSPPRVRLVSGGKHCSPIAGGAPFLTCCNCFELLLLSKKVLAKNNNRNKIRCGACSTVINFAVSNKNLVVSIDVEAKDCPIGLVNMHDVLPTNEDRHPNQYRTTFSSDDHDNSGYDFLSMEIGQVSAGQGRTNKFTEMKNHHPTSTHTPKAEEEWESSTAARKASILADQSTKSDGPLTRLGLSHQDRIEYSHKNHAENRFAEGNRSGRSEHEKVLANKNTARQISTKESSVTEIDISSGEFANTGTTFDSGEVGRETDHLKISRAAESIFGPIIKKSFKDTSRSGETFEQEKASVTVNGHLIPDRLIKRAEKLAGTIEPGHFWYDFRAGFWGAIGGPCLGIIPPFIEEFNYPMPEHCAGGNTHVFVNGRELSQKDLNLLGKRGLPTERDKSYIIEISGRVLDEDTGEELPSLGKLAPTVERLKHGFGMRTPKPVG